MKHIKTNSAIIFLGALGYVTIFWQPAAMVWAGLNVGLFVILLLVLACRAILHARKNKGNDPADAGPAKKKIEHKKG